MQKIFRLIVRVDTVLYKTFGIVSSFRRNAWTRCGQGLQKDLDGEHSKRDHLNALKGTNYTTKQALALED